MCLLFLYHSEDRKTSSYRIVIANNRDEFWDRPTKPAAFWENNPNIISGLDMEPGRERGTWLGVSKNGKMALLLNILDIVHKDKHGRGNLVTDFLTCDQSAEEYITEHIQPVAEQYNMFNLLLLDLRKQPSVKTHFNNFQKRAQTIPTGVMALDNGTLADPWQKSIHGKVKFEEIVQKYGTEQSKDELVSQLVKLLNDQSQYRDDTQLWKQAALSNMSEQLCNERSARFVFSPSVRYGTRTNTIILVDFDGNCEFIERTMKCPVDKDNIQWEVRNYQFQISTQNLSSPLS